MRDGLPGELEFCRWTGCWMIDPWAVCSWGADPGSLPPFLPVLIAFK